MSGQVKHILIEYVSWQIKIKFSRNGELNDLPDFFPLQGLNKMFDVFFNKPNDRLQRIVVGYSIEIEGTTEKICRAVG